MTITLRELEHCSKPFVAIFMLKVASLGSRKQDESRAIEEAFMMIALYHEILGIPGSEDQLSLKGSYLEEAWNTMKL